MVSPQERVSLQAPAKVNLYLKILGRREDGYHYLATLMQKISLFDRIEVERKRTGLQLHCPDSDLPENESNLAFRAAQVFLEKMKSRGCPGNPGAVITLRKSIPVAAGLGGGSSDAAAVIRALDMLFGTGCSEDELLDMGVSLGADVPFFISTRPAAWATGIGERLHAARPLSGYEMLVVNPGYSVSTPWVYEKFALTVGKNINNLENLQNPGGEGGAQSDFAKRSIRPNELANDLEAVTASQYPEIGLLKNKLLEYGAEAAMMSGSGPSVFGLFQESEAERAAVCAQELKKEYKATFLVDPLQS